MQWNPGDTVWYRVEGEDSCGNRRFGSTLSNLVLSGDWQDETNLLFLLASVRQGGIHPTISAAELSFRSQFAQPNSDNATASLVFSEWDSSRVSVPLNRTDSWSLSPDAIWQTARHYRLSVRNGSGDWSVSNSVLAQIRPRLFLADAFTPDRDGLNDSLHVLGMGMRNLQMEVWDRWGNLVHRGLGRQAAWNGRYANQESAPEGVYTVVITAIDPKGEVFRIRKSVAVIR
jgi:gliding motility-associated-like protein